MQNKSGVMFNLTGISSSLDIGKIPSVSFKHPNVNENNRTRNNSKEQERGEDEMNI